MKLLDLKLRARLLLGFAMVIALTVLAAIVTTYNLSGINAQAQLIRDESLPFMLLADKMTLDSLEVQQWITDASATGDSGSLATAESYANGVRDGIKSFRRMFEQEQDKANIELMDQISERFEKFYSEGLAMADAYINEGRQKGNEMMDAFDRDAKDLSALIGRLQQSQSSEALAATDNMSESIGSIRTLLIGATLAAVLISILISLVIANSIADPIKEAVHSMERMSDGYLDIQSKNRGNDEAGQLLAAIEDMAQRLRDVVANINIVADSVAQGSEELSSNSQQMSQSSSEQASAAEQVSSSIEQMLSNITQNSDNAIQTEKISLKTSNDADKSGRAVSQAVDAMKQIAQKINIIDEIARQTNLLALNAAIEAARAGEHGKGFAVVAAEVRKLAERSQSAAAEISELSKSTTHVSEEAGQMIGALLPEIQKTSSLIHEISAASGEMKVGADQIEKAITQLETTTQDSAATAENIASSAENLASQADTLRDTIGFFHLGQVGKRLLSGGGKAGVNFATIRFKHLQWKSRLRDFLDGKSTLTESQSVSHKDCDLGKWFYAEGMARFGHIEEMKVMDGYHKQLHDTVRHIVKLKHAGQTEEAEGEYEKIGPLSHKIIDLLNAIESKM